MFTEGKRLGDEPRPTSGGGTDASTPRLLGATGGAFNWRPIRRTPNARRIAAQTGTWLAVLIGVLAVIGLFLTAAGFTAGTRRWDESVSSWLADGRSDFFVRLAERLSKLADTMQILGFMALVTILLAIGRQWRAMLLIPLAMLVEISTFLAVNYIVGRPRPTVSKIGLGMHHTIDVVMGLLMGMAALTIAARALRVRAPIEWSVSRPDVVP